PFPYTTLFRSKEGDHYGSTGLARRCERAHAAPRAHLRAAKNQENRIAERYAKGSCRQAGREAQVRRTRAVAPLYLGGDLARQTTTLQRKSDEHPPDHGTARKQME